MQFVSPMPFQEALDKIGRRSPIGSQLSSSEWHDVPVALRERAFFSSRVESIRFLQRARDGITDFLANNRETTASGEIALKTGSRADFVKQMQTFLMAEGAVRKTGGLTDITSERRLGLIFDTQTRQAHDYGNWLQGQNPDVLDEFPVQRFIRVLSVKEERTSHQPFEGQARLKSDLDFWLAINQDFGVPWGPWGWGCGHDVEDVDRAEAESLGLIKPGETPKSPEQQFNSRLESSLKGLDQDMILMLRQAFGDQVEFTASTVQWKPRVQAPAPRPSPPPAPPPPTPRPGASPKPAPAPPKPKPTAAPSTPAPPAAPAPHKRSNPVSQAATIHSRMTKSSKDAVKRVLGLIDSAHDDGKLSPLSFSHKVSRRAQGTYWTTANEIGIRRGGLHPEMTAAHEIGHWIDDKALSGQGFSSDAHPDLKDWRKAIDASEAVRKLRTPPGSIRDRSYRRYLLSRRELWARSYAQYVAHKTGDQTMLRQISEVVQGRTSFYIDSQWAADDFLPIQKAIDDLFSKKGWL